MASFSSQPGRPAMFGDLSAQPGTGAIGLKESAVPFRYFPSIGSPFSLRGV